MTPPSAIASKTKQTKAGPEPQTAVTASKCYSVHRQQPAQRVRQARVATKRERTFSSMNRHFPSGVNKASKISRLTLIIGSEGLRVESTVIPSRICEEIVSIFVESMIF